MAIWLLWVLELVGKAKVDQGHLQTIFIELTLLIMIDVYHNILRFDVVVGVSYGVDKGHRIYQLGYDLKYQLRCEHLVIDRKHLLKITLIFWHNIIAKYHWLAFWLWHGDVTLNKGAFDLLKLVVLHVVHYEDTSLHEIGY